MFSTIKWLSLQAPLIMVVAMVTGKNVQEILALNIHDRMVLVRGVIAEVLGLVDAAVWATDPAGAGGVTITEDELAAVVDEADDIKPAIDALLATFNSAPE